MLGNKIRLELESPSDSADGQGGITRLWSGTRHSKGHLSPIGENIGVEWNRDTSRITHKFYMQIPAGGLTVSEKDRFKLKNRLFDIVEIRNPSEANKHLEIFLNEVK